jgi:ketosteroid isomerase-like protein
MSDVLGEMSSPDLATAETAMRHWRSGAARGDWSALLAMLDPEVTFHVPVAGFAGRQRGKAAATRFFDKLGAELRAELEVTSTLRADRRVGFEVAVRGTWLGRDFRQALCLVFLVADGRVRAFHEYLAWPGGLELGDDR